MDEYTKEGALYDEEETQEFIEVVLSCKSEEDRAILAECMLAE